MKRPRGFWKDIDWNKSNVQIIGETMATKHTVYAMRRRYECRAKHDGVLKRGTVRFDGYRFWSYQKRKDGGFYEVWRNPSSYEAAVEVTRVAVRNNRARKRP